MQGNSPLNVWLFESKALFLLGIVNCSYLHPSLCPLQASLHW